MDLFEGDEALVLSLGEIVSGVSEVTDQKGTVKNDLTALVKQGRLKRVAQGKYQMDLDRRSSSREETFSTSSPHRDKVVSYPVMEVGVGAGPASGQHPSGEYLMAPQSIVRGWTGGKLPSEKSAYWTTVRGTSMEPWLPDGSPIFVAECNEVIQGGRYVIYVDDSEAEVVKRLERIGGGILRVISDNPGHATQTLRWVEDDIYEDLDYGVKIRLRVRGVVLYPKDTGFAITKMIADRK